MAYCRQCGAALHAGTKFCPACGAAAGNLPSRTPAETQKAYQAPPRRKRKSLFGRWWFWVLVLIAAVSIMKNKAPETFERLGLGTSAPAASQAPRSTAQQSASAVKPSAAPSPSPAAAAKDAPADGIRPEVREFLDAYEACMNEYADFMQKYNSADSDSVVSMLGDYYSILARYSEFAEKMEDFDEKSLSAAETAYYLEVMNRVSQTLLRAAG